MGHQALILFFLQVAVMLAVALICGQVMRRLHQPGVLGELIGGILLGPTLFGAVAPDLYHRLFPTNTEISLGLDAIIKVGMLFFLFVAGLEVNLAHLQQRGTSVALTSLLGVLVPLGLGAGTVLLFPGLWQLPEPEQETVFALFIGAALSISALPVIARILMDLHLIQQEIGVIIMTAATINDLIGWSLFAVVLSTLVPDAPVRSLAATLGLVAGFSALTLGFGHWFGQASLQWLRSRLTRPGGFIGMMTVLVLAAAALAEWIGIHAIFGAFLIGVAVGQKLEKENEAHQVIYQFAVSFFAPLYFVSIGLKANFAANFDGVLVGVILVIACIGKIGGAGLGAWLGGIPLKKALAIGFGMNARGAMEIILASVALEHQLIDQRIFVALVIMALVTSLLSGPAMQHLMQSS